ncbi:hypothetical protein P154DRAFT_539100 [Amniculicola lignicola CBS 123094]|uniref:F-box domain-containing protein n=1 Tax=Amniculicola lignicola CBS 123094 TaxID=1392246 RepID=A0A6A5VZQ3_9PLEO|nr:hypothetical protein P154DRAFT_539100 [Amniculicola lignicola CBS 123094]
MSAQQPPPTTSKASSQVTEIEALAKAANPKPRFERLPTEMVRAIFERVCFKKDLGSLSLTCKRLHEIVEEFLYHTYHYGHSYNEWDGNPTCRQACRLTSCFESSEAHTNRIKVFRYAIACHTSCTDNVRRAKVLKIKSARIGVRFLKGIKRFAIGPICGSAQREMRNAEYPWLYYGVLYHDMDNECATALGYTSKVEVISLELTPSTDNVYGEKTLQLLRAASQPSNARLFHGFPFLKKLSIQFGKEPGTSATPNISRIIMIPTLRTLQLTHAKIEEEREIWGCPVKSSPVTTVDIIKPTDSKEGWKTFLASFAALERVYVEFKFEYPTGDVWHLRDFIAALYPHKNSLEFLAFEEGGIHLAPPNHSPQPTLQQFYKLQGLRLFSLSLWMDSWRIEGAPPFKVSDTLALFIPPTLQELQIGHSFHGTVERPMRQQMPTTEDWVSLTSKTPFISLRRVRVWDYSLRVKYLYYDWDILRELSWSKDGVMNSIIRN